MSNADIQIQAINTQLKPLYAQLAAGDTSVQDKINTLVALRTTYEQQSNSDAQLSYDWQAVTNYVTQDAPKVTSKAISNIGATVETVASGVFSFTKWIVIAGVVYLAIKIFPYIFHKK